MAFDGKISGLGSAITNSAYQANLNQKIEYLFDGKQQITSSELLSKDVPLFDAYKRLDAQAKERFNQILSLDGDAKTVTQSEYRTLSIILDSNLKTKPTTGKEYFEMDGLMTTSGMGGIYQAKDNEITLLHSKIKSDISTKASAQNSEMNDMKRLSDIKTQLQNYDLKDDSNFTMALEYTLNNLPSSIDMKDEAFKMLFGDNLDKYQKDRGNGIIFYLKDGTVIKHQDNLINSSTTITKDGVSKTYDEKGNPVN